MQTTSAISFSEEHLTLARQLNSLGLPWQPATGQFVYDPDSQLPHASPFQTGVYFLLDYDCFMRHAGGLDRFLEFMVWIPAWSDARSILRDIGVKDQLVQETLIAQRAIENNRELLSLYEIIRNAIRNR